MFEYDPYDIMGTGIWQDAEKLARKRYGEQDWKTFLTNARRILREMKREAKTPAQKRYVKKKENDIKRLFSQRDIGRKNLTIKEVNQMGRDIREDIRKGRHLTMDEVRRMQKDMRRSIQTPSIYANAPTLPRSGRLQGILRKQQNREILDLDDDQGVNADESDVSIPQGEVPQGVIEEAPDELTNDEYDTQNSRLKRKLDFCELNKKLNMCLSGNISYLQPNISIGSVGSTPNPISYRPPYQPSYSSGQPGVPDAPSIDVPSEVQPPSQAEIDARRAQQQQMIALRAEIEAQSSRGSQERRSLAFKKKTIEREITESNTALENAREEANDNSLTSSIRQKANNAISFLTNKIADLENQLTVINTRISELTIRRGSGYNGSGFVNYFLENY